MRPLPRILIVLAALALFVASCSSGGGDAERADDGPTTSRTPTTSGTDSTDDGDGNGGGGPIEDPLRLGLSGPVSLDPAAISPASVSSMILVDLVHDTLTEVGDDGVVRPGLASFESNPEQTVWRFVLGADATFADGSAITAGDVATSIDRIRAQGGASLAAIQLEDIVAVTPLDARTLDIGLAAPSAVLPVVLASPLYGILDADRLPGAVGAPVNPSGAPTVAAAAARRVLERRRGTGPATVELRLFPDDAAAYDAMSAGELDWSPVPVDRLGEAGSAFGLGGLVPFHATVLLGIDPNAEPLSRAPLRQAISLAIDRRTLTEAVFGPTAQALPGLIPAGTPGAAEDCVGFCGPDVDTARRLVAEAFPDGAAPALRLLTDDSATQTAIAGILGEQLGAIGVELAPLAVDAATYESFLGVGQQQLFVYTTLGVGLTPASHLLPWHSTSPDNLGAYGQGLVDEAIRAAVAEPDPALRTARWREIEAAVLADVPVVPLAQLRTVAVVRERVRGLHVRSDGSIDVSRVELRGG
ncbi:MAG: ABC transporter substrate-binding protein [Acidimicrobiia bacterium]